MAPIFDTDPAVAKPAEGTRTPSPRPPLPPDWALERFFKTVGRAPAAAGRALTRAADFPVLGILVRAFSSVILGIIWLALIGAYIAFGSGFATMRAKLEMTDLQFFDAWPMRVLLVLLAVNLTVVTLRRIPLTLFKLGVWMVHIGILTLIGGSVWYFSQKQEGSVRIFLHQSVGSYFDATERALYAFAVDKDGVPMMATSTMTPLPTLPFFYEHLRENGKALDIALPAQTLGAIDPALGGATVRITGYYPAAEMGNAWAADPAAVADATGDAPNPAVRVSLALEGVSSGQWLIGKSPAERVLDGPGVPFGVEYLYHPTEERYAEVGTEFKGATGITVRVPKFGVNRSYTVEAGQTLAIEGTPYTLTIGDQQAMPLISKGYEGSMSNSLMVTVEKKGAVDGVQGSRVGGDEVRFNRMVLTRYPERSPDFVVGKDGTQKRVQDRVDNDIQMTFEDASRDQFWIVERLDRPLELIHRMAGGAVERFAVVVGKAIDVKVSTVPMTVAVLERAARVMPNFYPAEGDSPASVPQIIPAERRPRSISAMEAMQSSVVELEVIRSGQGSVVGGQKGGSWVKKVYVPFSQFAQLGAPPGGKQPAIVEVPGMGRVGFILSTVRRELPSVVTLADFKAVKYAGAENSYENYMSTLAVKDKGTGDARTLVAELNAPATDHGLYYFQSAWDGEDVAPPERRFSVIGVGNRPGIEVMIVGAVMMLVGIGYSFYVKPVLLKVKKEGLARWVAEGRGEV